jgi:hypothetical protein
MDLVPQDIPLQATLWPIKGKCTLVIVPTFPVESLVRPEMVHQHEREVEYFRDDKGTNKRKRVFANERKQMT